MCHIANRTTCCSSVSCVREDVLVSITLIQHTCSGNTHPQSASRSQHDCVTLADPASSVCVQMTRLYTFQLCAVHTPTLPISFCKEQTCSDTMHHFSWGKVLCLHPSRPRPYGDSSTLCTLLSDKSSLVLVDHLCTVLEFYVCALRRGEPSEGFCYSLLVQSGVSIKLKAEQNTE